MQRIFTLSLTLLALGVGTCHAMTGGSVDPAFRGEWVPAQAECTSPLRLVIAANQVTFVNGSQRADYRRLEQCFTCMGHKVDDITLLSTDEMGDSPFMIYLDASTTPHSVRIAFPNEPQLGERFPFGRRPLKQCP